LFSRPPICTHSVLRARLDFAGCMARKAEGGMKNDETFDGNRGAPIPAAPTCLGEAVRRRKLPSEGWSDPARFCWHRNTRRAGSRFANPSFARKQLRRTGAGRR
jgi:hypothetical protein